MLDYLEPFVDLDAEPGGAGGHYFKLTEEQREVCSQGGNVVSDGEWLCENLDRFFYRFDKAWEDEVVAWLKAGAPGLEFRNDS